MRINYAPLLYGRTYYVDFSSQFLAQPDFFTKKDEADFFSLVRASMDHSDFIDNNGRRVVFGNGKYVVTGLVIKFEELFYQCGREPVYNRLDHENGRLAHGFIGIVIPVSNFNKVFDISLDTYLNLYCELIAPIWNEKFRKNALKVPSRELEVTEGSQTVDSNMEKTVLSRISQSEMVIWKDAIENRENICRCVISLAMKGHKVAFCSNADSIRPEYRKIFQVVTCENPSAFSVAAKNETTVSEREDYYVAKSDYKSAQGYDDILEKVGNSYNSDLNQTESTPKKDKPLSKAKQSSKAKSERKVPSYDDILNAWDTMEGEEEKYSDTNDIKKKALQTHQPQKKPQENSKLQLEQQLRSQKNWTETILDEEISNRTRTSKMTPADGAAMLGTVAGVIYCVVGAVNLVNAVKPVNPVVLAIVGAVTIVIGGIEAKRIIDMFNSQE